MIKKSIGLGAVGMFMGVLTGAFGAHSLEKILSNDQLNTWNVAVDYLFIHSLGLILIGLLHKHSEYKCHLWAVRFMVAGILLFSGSLYILVLTHTPWLGIVTPLGGLSFLIAWSILIKCYLTEKN